MKERILEKLNQNKQKTFFVRIPLEITDKVLYSSMATQNKNVLENLPRKLVIVIKIEDKYYKLNFFDLEEISEEVFEFPKCISEYYPNDNTYRFLYNKIGFYLDVDELDGFDKYQKDSQKNLKDELWNGEEGE